MSIASIRKQNTLFGYHIIIIIVFTFLYYQFQTEEDKELFKNPEEAMYFAVINHFTVGLGDIAPKSKRLRRLCMLQVILAFVFFTT